MNRLHKRGIALITVMAVLVLCLMLLGAFLQTNRHYLQLYKGGQQRDAVGSATQSAFEFCRFELERDNTWGLPFTESRSYSRGNMEVRELVRESVGDREGRLEITFADSGSKVRVAILNNIAFDATSPEQVPANSCRFRIESELGSSRSGADIVVRKMAYFSSTAVASEKVRIDALVANFHSRDPIHNQIRSQGDIELGSLINSEGKRRFNFRPDGDSQNANAGTVWAKGDISLDGQNGRNSSILSQAAAETGASWIDQGRSHSETPELKLEDIDPHTGDELLIEPGSYKFTRSQLQWQDYSGGWNDFAADTPLLEHWQNGKVQTVYFPYENTGTLPPERFRLKEFPDAEVSSSFYSTTEFEIQDGVKVNLATKKIAIDANRNAKVKGDFEVTTDSWDVIPTLHFASVTDWTKRGSLSATGDIDIKGQVYGLANLLAGNDLTIAPNYIDQDKEAEHNSTNSNIALYAGRDVTIKPPDTGTWGINSHVAFRGLVYADNNFKFVANETRVSGQTLTIEGALVARKGSIDIQNAFHANLIYNPDYLTDLIKKQEGNRGQVEMIAWRPK